MFISDFAISRPIVTVTAMLALVVFGAIALVSLQTDEFPDVQQPVIAVSIAYPGASPETVEREVVDPIEDAVFAISGIDAGKTISSSSDGLAQLVVFFDFEKDIQQASQDIRDAISSKRADLPLEMEEPILTRFDPADLPIVSVALSSDTLSVATLTRLADPGIVRELRGLQGVAQVSVVGGLKRELTVQVIPEALKAAGVGVDQVVGALQAQNLAAPVGRINETFDERTIRLLGRLETPEEFAQLVVAERDGQQIRLGQLARVFDGTEEQRTLALLDRKEAVGLEVLKSKGYSTTQVADEIARRIAQLQPTLPPGAKLEIIRNSGARVADAVRNVQSALLEGALLTVLVVFLFLNSWRSTVITGLALPISVLASFISIWVFGFTLNTMSLLGLSLAIGILIDDAIVVRENIVRHLEMGQDTRRAAHEGTNQIGLAVTATTLSIVAVFVPVAFMYGVAGQWFKPFALTIACAVLVSLFVSFSLDPMLSAYWHDPQVAEGKRGPVTRVLSRFNAWFDRMADRYTHVIAWALDHRLLTIGGATLMLVVSVGAQALFGGAGFVPTSDRSEIDFIVETPPGSSLEYTRRKVEAAVEIARAHPEVAYTYSTLGTPVPLRAPGVDQAQVYVQLKPKRERSLSQEELGAILRQETSRLAGATVSVFTSGFGGTFKQIQVELRGTDPRRLTALGEEVVRRVRQVPGAVDVGLSTRGQKPELMVEVDRGLAGRLGVTMASVAASLRAAFAGIDSGDWVDPDGETRDVTVRLAPEFRERPSDLTQLPLVIGQDPDGAPITVPLGQVATVRRDLGPAQIDHLARDTVVNVQANVHGRSLSEVNADIQRGLATLQLPPGYRITLGGEVADQQEVFSRIFLALAVAVLLMYLILVIQFGSFLDPLAILLSLPLSLVGVVLALLLTGDTLNIMSLIGVILLFGIVAKNAILLIDFAKWARARGVPMRDALIEAGRIRLRPIVMTTVAIIAGMIPVALGTGEGGDFRAPLGRAVIGGVITSTLLTLLVIPTVYEILDGWRAWAKRRAQRLFRAPPATAPKPEEAEA